MAGFVHPSRRSIVADDRSDASNEVQRSRPVSMPPCDVENDFYRDERRRNDNRQTVARNHIGTLVTPNGMDGAHDLPSKASVSKERPEPKSRPTSVPPPTDPRRRVTVAKPPQSADGSTTAIQHQTTEESMSPPVISGEDLTELRKADRSSPQVLKSELIRMGELTYDKGLQSLRVAQQQRDLAGVQRELQIHANSSRQHPPLVEVLEGKVLEGNKKLRPMVLNLSASSKKASAQAESVVQTILAVLTAQIAFQVKEVNAQVSEAKKNTEGQTSHNLSTFVKLEDLNAHFEERDVRLRAKMDTLRNQHKTELDLVKAEMVAIQTSRNQHKTELESIKEEMELMQTTSNDSTNDIDLLKAEMALMKREKESFKTDIESLKAEVRSMKDASAEPPSKIDATPPLLSIHLRQYKKFVTETNQRISDITEKRKEDDDTAGTELDQIRSKQEEIASTVQDLQKAREVRSSLPPQPPCLSVADATLLSNAGAYGAQIENMERKLALNSKRLDTEATSLLQATDLSNTAKQLSEANQHSIQSLNARYNNLNTEQLARHLARVLQPLPASIQADHTVLQRTNAELSVKVDGIQRKVDEELSQLQQLRSSVSTLEGRDHGASSHGNAASEELKQEVQRLKGAVDEHHNRQNLILRVITDGKVSGDNGSASADLVTQESLSQQVQASILRIAGPRLDSKETRISLGDAAAARFHEMMDQETALQKEQIEGCVKDTVQDKVDFVAVQLTEQVDASVSRAMSEGQYPTITQLHAHETDVRELKKVLKGWVESFERKKGKGKASGAPVHPDPLSRDREPGSALPSPNLESARQGNMTRDQVAKLNTPSSSSTSFDQLQNEVSTLQDKVGDFGSDLEDLKEQVNDLNGRVMLGVFRGDIKSSANTISPPLLQEKVSRGGSKLASTLDVAATKFKTVPSTKLDLETLNTKCSVRLEDGSHCRRNLSCKIHNKTAKRAVHGRSQPFDQLEEAWLNRGSPTNATLLATAGSARDSSSTDLRRPLNSHIVSDTESRSTSGSSSHASDAKSGLTGQTSTEKRHMWDPSTSESDSDDNSTIEVSSKQRPSKRFKGA